MNFTIEALYLLHIYNEFSDDLAFLPLANPQNLSRKDLLRQVVKKGYQDLKDMRLIEDGIATDDCVKYGIYLKEYHEKSYHYSVDQAYFVAPEVDKYKRQSVVFHLLEDGTYYLDRVTSVMLWGYLQEGHNILHHLDDKIKDYLNFDWDPYSLFRTIVKNGDSDAIQLTILKDHQVIENTLYMTIDNSLYEYDVSSQKRRSIDSLEMMEVLIDKAKVRL